MLTNLKRLESHSLYLANHELKVNLETWVGFTADSFAGRNNAEYAFILIYDKLLCGPFGSSDSNF